MMTGEVVIIGRRNCYLCGVEFPSEGARICPRCRRAKSQKLKEAVGTPLSLRHRQVVGLIAQGKLNKEIAFELHLTEGTIKEYLNRIFQRVGVTNRTELAVWWVQQESKGPNE
jgi:DNA-binding NarL/FixJ family response regulator